VVTDHERSDRDEALCGCVGEWRYDAGLAWVESGGMRGKGCLLWAVSVNLFQEHVIVQERKA
jgi:hypothetical protein